MVTRGAVAACLAGRFRDCDGIAWRHERNRVSVRWAWLNPFFAECDAGAIAFIDRFDLHIAAQLLGKEAYEL